MSALGPHIRVSYEIMDDEYIGRECITRSEMGCPQCGYLFLGFLLVVAVFMLLKWQYTIQKGKYRVMHTTIPIQVEAARKKKKRQVINDCHAAETNVRALFVHSFRPMATSAGC